MTTQPTDLALKRVLSELLPERIRVYQNPQFSHPSFFWNGYTSNPEAIKDTEWLQIVWEVKQGLSPNDRAAFAVLLFEEVNQCQVIRPTIFELFNMSNATWQQETVILAKVLGKEIEVCSIGLDAYVQIDNLKTQITQAKAKLETLKTVIRDDCETEDRVKALARPYLEAIQVDGDSNGVPNEADIVESLCKKLELVKRERDEASKNKIDGGHALMICLASRLINRICTAADMSLPETTDIELSLARIIQERETLKLQLSEALNKLEAEQATLVHVRSDGKFVKVQDYDTLKRQNEELVKLFGNDTPYPLTEVLSKLIESTEHLLNDNDGHEGYRMAVNQAKIIRTNIYAASKPS